MTKYELREYRKTKAELSDLDVLTRKIERHATEELRRLYATKRERLSGKLKRIEEAIDGLEPVERHLMRLRYIDGLEWWQVAAAIHYSVQQTHRIHARALIKLKDK